MAPDGPAPRARRRRSVKTPDTAPLTIAAAVETLVRLTADLLLLADALADHLEADALHAVAERLLVRIAA
ncbi:hypothetical protein ABT263_33040 [Kitasatospora sp. NPDC001603]|uniref:hypothetical protein n=1 Tax=Kitasatospora sp. NPDC001603 TaxID=3154388 RepID=UPI00332169D5